MSHCFKSVGKFHLMVVHEQGIGNDNERLVGLESFKDTPSTSEQRFAQDLPHPTHQHGK